MATFNPFFEGGSMSGNQALLNPLNHGIFNPFSQANARASAMAHLFDEGATIEELTNHGISETVRLLQLLHSTNWLPKSVRETCYELESLLAVLNAINTAAEEDGDEPYLDIRLPIWRCAGMCQAVREGNERTIAGRETTMEEWGLVGFWGGDLTAFRETCSAYRSAFYVALAMSNLRNSRVSRNVLDEYKRLAIDASYDLQARAVAFEAKIKEIVPHPIYVHPLDRDPVQQKYMQLEKLSIGKCLNLIDNLTELRTQIENDRPPGREHSLEVKFWNDSSDKITTLRPLLSHRLKELTDRVDRACNPRMSLEQADFQREKILQLEIQCLQKCISMCDRAIAEADMNSANVFEDVTIGDDGVQTLLSTTDRLIFAKGVKAGARSLQIMGQLPEELVAKLAEHHGLDTTGASSSKNSRGVFQERYGAGRDLRTVSSHSPVPSPRQSAGRRV